MPNINLFIVLIFILGKLVKCDIDVTNPLFKELPPIFQLDDDKPCRAHNKLHCKLSITLHPIDEKNKSAHWKVIEDTIKHSKFYNHNELYHAICINDFCPGEITVDNSGTNMTGKLSKCYGLKYPNMGLKFVVTELNCRHSEFQFSPGVVDTAVLVVVILYFTLVGFATYTDYRAHQPNKSVNSGRSYLILQLEHIVVPTFSLLANWRKLCSLNDRQDFQKLKFIQGIRFYNMLLIIFCHTVCSYIGGYIANTEYLELVYRNQWRLSVATLFLFLVQTFFLISAFLLSYHVCQTMEVYKESKWKYAFLAFLNRYLRILPPVVVMITLSNTIWVMVNFQGPIKELYFDKEYQRCQRNWWTNLMFINNHYNAADSCYFLTWYLAADTQLYLISLIILLLIWKFRHRSRTIIGAAIAIGILIPTVICYKYGLDVIYRLTPENSKNDNFRSFKFNAIYTSTFTNMASYMVGLGLGCFYYSLERSNVYTKFRQTISLGLFSLLPIATVLISSQDHSRPVNILLSGIIKPCYALGIGAGILAMSQQKYGIIKKICEWRPVLFLGNFTYSTYVVQYGLVFYRTAVARQPLLLSDFILVTSFVQDAVLSIFCGFLMHILVEMPVLQLQKMLIPQIRHIPVRKCTKSE